LLIEIEFRKRLARPYLCTTIARTLRTVLYTFIVMPGKFVIELILLAALWGASFLFMRVATPEFGAIALIELRVLIAGLVLLPFWFAREASANRWLVRSEWRALATVGILNSAIPFVLFAYATLYITGGFASILNATAPIWGALVAWLWLRKTMPINGIIGLALGFLGVVYLVSGSFSLSFDEKTLGVLAASIAPFLYGVAANYTSEKMAHISPLAIATFSQLSAAIVLLPISLFFLPDGDISTRAWLSVLAMAVLCTSIAYLMFFRLIVNIGPTRAITVTFLIPVFGMFWGAMFIDETITWRMIVGSVVILLGTALVTNVLRIKVPKFMD